MDISITHLTYHYSEEEKPVLEDVNLHIQSGEWCLISGLSGSGKTTLAYAMAGILYHQELGSYQGQVKIGEHIVEEIPLYQISDMVGFVQQNADNQFCTLNVAEEMAFGLENKCIEVSEMKQRIHEALRETQAEESLLERSLFELSGGEKQKIAIASILALQPSILILDEPTSNLDIESTRLIFEVLQELHREKNITVILIEHKVNLFAPLFKRCIFLDGGKITFDGETERSPLFLSKKTSRNPRKEENVKTGSVSVLLKDWNYSNGNGFRLEVPELALHQGEIIALMGPNGSGKTTLMKTICGMLKPTHGNMTKYGKEIQALEPRQCGFVFQNADDQLFTNSVTEEIQYGLDNFHCHDTAHLDMMDSLLETFRLQGRRTANPHQLSYGEKKRLNLAATLVYDPDILLLDEIFIGQDIYQVQFIIEKLKELRDAGMTIMAAIHDLSLVQVMADRVLFLENGRLQFDLAERDTAEWWHSHGYRDYVQSEGIWV
ncbi:MAG TPA: hypothetical protein DCK95_06030 [Anaerolineaceae bacterium]|nr:hypothetical protein [Anaerolineaceae bacterium]